MKYLYPKNLKSKANACLMEKLFLGQYIVRSCASSAQDVYKKRKCKKCNQKTKKCNLIFLYNNVKYERHTRIAA